ncbi:thioredoxin domain-containing protein 11 isoform X3 [Latimeria chalumnae]|uniref:thioredoxin domain-containing protein 11 isoform X3 n=1 Tax=Latimeria chalumnae TaxID=7897 RepID=UPI00313AE3A6
MLRWWWLHVRNGLSQMARRPELLCGAIVLSCILILTLKFTFSRAKDVVVLARPPVRFFSARSPVIDLYRGQLDQAEQIRSDSEVSLLYFYAPWCGQSITAKVEIEQVAKRLVDQVLFVAVNCWWNQGKCRKQKNLFYYPVIYLYHRRFAPIEYKGPLTAAYIEKFIRRVMSPLLYIPSRTGLLDFLAHYEPRVLGYFEFNASPQPPGYLTFFTSALYALKKDYLVTLRFGVITNQQIAKEISLENTGSVYLHRHFNTSLVFPRDSLNFTAENIYKWAVENREILLRWLHPHGGKSLLLNNELKKGPALLLFLPFNPLAEGQPLLNEFERLNSFYTEEFSFPFGLEMSLLITQVVLEYNNCNGSRAVQHILQHLQQPDQPVLGTLFPCSHFHSTEAAFIRTQPCCNTVVLPQWHLISRTHNVCELCVNQTVGVRPSLVNIHQCSFFEMEVALDSFYLKEHNFVHFMSKTIECSNFPSFYSPFSYYTACCKTISRGLINSAPSKHRVIPDPKESSSSYGKNIGTDSQNSFSHIEDGRTQTELPVDSSSLSGLKCRTNKTLNIYLLDSNLTWKHAVRLGASGSGPLKELTTIVDLKNEVHYIMDQNQVLAKPSLEAFIQNYSTLNCPLRRHLVASLPVQSEKEPLITEVTTETFHSVVLDIEKDVLLLYYTQWCGFCSVLNHIFIQLARLLHTNSNFIIARKDMSVKYPEDLQPTLPNLVRFILKHTCLSHPLYPQQARTHETIHKAAELQQSKLHHLEKEIQKLRIEIQALQQAQDQLSLQLFKARRDKNELQIQNWALEEKNTALQQQSKRLQELYKQKSEELEETAEKLQELADASENLLTENTLLKMLVVSMDKEINANKANQEKASDQTGSDGTSIDTEEKGKSETWKDHLDDTLENRTDI